MKWQSPTFKKQELCLSCKECCKWIEIPTNHQYTLEVVEFYEARGWSVIKRGDTVCVYKKETCPHLTDEGCNIYVTRPVACRVYDASNDPLVECKWKTK